jgi:prepilin-type N-terminal cleavage/methylation domain-containing protein
MLKNRSSRTGFTLPEVLVTVAIIAVLAAAVVPTVVNQMSKGEAGAVVSDFNSLSAGITTFVTDVRRYPRTLAQLNTRPTASSALFLDLRGAQYSAAAVNSWKGPYLATTQFPGTTPPDGYVFSGLNIKADTLLDAPAAANGFHITLSLVPASGASFTEAEILAIDQIIDAGNGAVATGACASTQPNGTSGRLTWTSAGAATPCTISAVKYRLVPTGS